MMLYWGSSPKAKGRTDGLKSWKYPIQWPKVNRTVTWLNILHLALSHLLITVREQIQILNISTHGPRSLPPAVTDGRGRQPRNCPALTSTVTATQLQQNCWAGCHIASGVTSDSQLSRDCWILIPGNEARTSKGTAGFSDHRLGWQGLGLGRAGIML